MNALRSRMQSLGSCISALNPLTLVRLLRDNPVLDKDALTSLRAPVAPYVAAGVLLGAWTLALLVHLATSPTDHSLANWGTLQASGRPILAAVVGLLLALQSFIVPALAASTIAGERERGTLPLLQVTSLSPARIVAGKVGALLVVLAPLAIAAVPLTLLSVLFGGVEAHHALLAVSFLAFHGVILSCVGVGASSLAKRSRFANPLAMVFSLVPALMLALPGAITLGFFVDGETDVDFTPLLAFGAFTEILVAAACLLLARDRLSPATAPRWPLRRIVTGAFLVGVPVVAVAVLHLFGAGVIERDVREGVTGAVLFGGAFLVACTMLFEICSADVHRVDQLSARRQALVVTGLAVTGLVIARLIPAPAVGPMPPWYSEPALADLSWPSIGIAALYILFCASTAAFVSRLVARPWPAVRIVVTVVLLGALFALPLFLHEVRYLLALPPWTLGFTNPAVVMDGLESTNRYRLQEVSLVGAVAFFTLSSVAMLAFARPRRR